MAALSGRATACAAGGPVSPELSAGHWGGPRGRVSAVERGPTARHVGEGHQRGLSAGASCAVVLRELLWERPSSVSRGASWRVVARRGVWVEGAYVAARQEFVWRAMSLARRGAAVFSARSGAALFRRGAAVCQGQCGASWRGAASGLRAQGCERASVAWRGGPWCGVRCWRGAARQATVWRLFQRSAARQFWRAVCFGAVCRDVARRSPAFRGGPVGVAGRCGDQLFRAQKAT